MARGIQNGTSGSDENNALYQEILEVQDPAGGLLDNKEFIDWAINFRYDSSQLHSTVHYTPNGIIASKFFSANGAQKIESIS